MEAAGQADHGRPEAGLAHVAVLAFVAARTVPGFGFPVSLAGGTAVAHASERLGGRRGLAAGVAAAIESVAILGPARMSGPGGQLITAPLIGALAGRGAPRAIQIAACALVRAFFNVVTTALFIVVIAGGVDNYAGTYDATIGRLPGAPEGAGFVLAATGALIAAWSVGASWFQVYVFERAGGLWRERGGPMGASEAAEGSARHSAPAPPPTPTPAAAAPPIQNRRLDPRAVTLAAMLAFGLLLASTAPVLLGAVTLWLAVAWALAPAERDVLRPGLFLAATLALGAFIVNWVGGDSVRDGLEHGARGALLVLTATWMRGAAGSDGVRAVARRVLVRLRRLPAARELRTALDSISGDRRLGEAVRALLADLRRVEGELLDVLDAALAWIAAEAARFRPVTPTSGPALRYGALDGAVLIAAALPALALAPG